ncbi:MAG: TonB-dependent receptor [Muribaculaceae bacterium]
MKNICFQMNRKAWLTLLLALCLSLPALAQKIAVQGTVVDDAGEPLIGANVVPKGTTIGTATDLDGKFSIEVAPDATLVVSYVGYTPVNVAVAGRTNIKVQLKGSSVNLDEVVAIGYGVVKKSDATGAVSTVKPSEIEVGLATSAQDLLIGKTPGLVVTSSGGGPEGGATLRIRGGSSLNANNDPLIVIDGVPIDNSSVQGMSNPLAMIAPDNIESMTVLKDASATAIYGSRASNGVIIVTTKKGTAGKPQVNFSANMYVNTARKTWNPLDATGLRNQLVGFFGEKSEAVGVLGKSNTNWQDQVLRTTVSSDYNLSVGGTAGFLPYRVAVTYTNNNGILKGSKMDRLTAGFNLSPKFFNGLLSVNANAKGYFLKNKFADSGAVGAAIAADPTKPVYSPWKSLYNGYTTWMNGAAYNPNATQNPLSIIEDRNNVAEVWRSNGNLQIDYALHFLPELHFNLNLGYDVSRTIEHNIVAQNSPSSWHNAKNDGASTDSRTYQFKSNTLLDFYANYRKQFDAIYSNLDVTAGYSWQRFFAEGTNNGNMYKSAGFFTPSISDGNYILTTNKETIDRIGDTYTPSTAWANHLQLLSFFGRLNYSFMDRYLLTFTMRADATSRFAKENRWGWFPSVALAWKVTDEAFMESVRDVMNELKLRAGYGITGQQDIGSYFPYLAVYKESTQGSLYPNLDGTPGYGSTLYPLGYDSNLKWEQTATWNAGVDVAFLNNRITASLDYYYRTTKDLLSFVTVSPGSATTNMMNQNIGTLENQGVEFAISAKPIVTKDFTWSVGYNIAWNENKITKLNNDGSLVLAGDDISGATGNKVQAHKVGYPAFSFYLWEQVYDKAGKPLEGQYVDQDGNGVINDDDLVLRHSKDPKVTMSFNTNFNYKNWDLGFVLRANIGNYVYNNTLAQRTNLSNTYKNSGISNLIENDFYFQGTGTLGLYKSDYWLRNGSFVRCDNITLGYTWPSLIKDQLRLRLYGAVQNPFVISKYKGLDPEVFSGIDNNVYPRPVTFTLGLVATF